MNNLTVLHLIIWSELQASLGAQMVKNLPEMQETQVQLLGQEDPLEKKMATRSSILAWKSPWTEEPGGLQFMRLRRGGQDWSDLAQHTYAAIDIVIFLHF